MEIQPAPIRVEPPSRRPLGYRSLLVPVLERRTGQRALEAAGRLAADRGAAALVVTVLEVPFSLPLDALLVDEERAARELLRRARTTFEGYGIEVATRLLRARGAADAIIRLAAEQRTDLIVLGTRRGGRRHGVPFGKTVRGILKDAPCEVVLVAPHGG